MNALALPPRARAAVLVTRGVNALSRHLGTGSGTVAGGHAGLAVDPELLAHLAAGRRVALVTGTNGKTTTTRLLAVAVEGALGPAATNATGSNMPQGHVTALATSPPGAAAVLEVDEGYVPGLVASLTPDVVVLLNLSRDQLDRTNEVRMVASRWRRALADAPRTVAVANADDPLVAWAAQVAARPVWVAAGLSWRADAVGCPACEGRIVFAEPPAAGWSCTCGFSRPAPDVWIEGEDLVTAGGRRTRLRLQLPGRFNRLNAAMAAAAAGALGVPADEAVARMGTVGEVAGRFALVTVGGSRARLMLAKNPAGWVELLDLVCPGHDPVVVGINARAADGRDPSWLWDVPFERLAGRFVVATGERCRDLAVRLRYAEVDHRAVPDPVAAVRLAAMRLGAGRRGAGTAGAPVDVMAVDGAPVDGAPVDVIGNYTAFHDLLSRAAGR